jgi:hypothetical protein
MFKPAKNRTTKSISIRRLYWPTSLKRLYHSPKWTGPPSLNAPGAGEEKLRDALEVRALQRRHAPAQTMLTNADFRNAAKALFDLTRVIPEAYWSYGMKFE